MKQANRRLRFEDLEARLLLTTWHVATNGSDSGDGCEARPYRLIQDAVNKAEPGDKILVREGTYVQAVDMVRSGKADAYISLEGQGKVTLRSNTIDRRAAFDTGGYSFMRFRNFYFENVFAGIQISSGSHHIDLDRIDVKDSDYGLLISDRNREHGRQEVTAVSDITARNITATRNRSTERGDGIRVDKAVNNDVIDLLFENITLSGFSYIANGKPQGDGLIIEDFVKNVTIRDAILFENADSGADIKGDDITAQRITAYHNGQQNIKSWGNNNAVFDSLLYYTKDPVARAVNVRNGDITFVNSTIVDGQIEIDDEDDIIINGVDVRPFGMVTFVNSIVTRWTGTGDWKVENGRGENIKVDQSTTLEYDKVTGVGIDPMFVDRSQANFRLEDDSLAINKGNKDLRVPSAPANDSDGHPRVSGIQIDKGAYERQFPSSATPVTNSDSSGLVVLEDATLAIGRPGVLANDADADSNILAAILTGLATHGFLNLKPDGEFIYSPFADYNGSDTFFYRATDGWNQSNLATVTITITPVNDAPCFTKGPNQVVNDSTEKSVPNWATAIVAGPADESAQQLMFTVTVNNPALFTTPPLIDPTGKLTFTPAPNATGSAIVTVVLSDDGGIENGGKDTSASHQFTITFGSANAFQQDNGPDGLVVMEAESNHGSVSQGGRMWTLRSDISGYSGSGALQALPDIPNSTPIDSGYELASPRLDFNVNFVNTGRHYVWIRGLGPSGNGDDDSVHVGLDGDGKTTADRIDGFTTTYGWTRSTLDQTDIAYVDILSGPHTVNVWMREDGIIVDKVLLTTNMNLIPEFGDYNQNRTVDAADYVMWRKTLNQSVTPYSGADGDGDGVVDQDDYNIWRANFGRTLPLGSSAMLGAGQNTDKVGGSASENVDSLPNTPLSQEITTGAGAGSMQSTPHVDPQKGVKSTLSKVKLARPNSGTDNLSAFWTDTHWGAERRDGCGGLIFGRRAGASEPRDNPGHEGIDLAFDELVSTATCFEWPVPLT